ncbi:MAG: hypothetical protein QOG44_2466, partial [Acidimicrobiaceae bacterium]|nr:hypothetical protein [Acidimicrobiaceae bacterium]
ANNNPAGPTPCGAPSETVIVGKFPTGLATTATPMTAPVGASIHDTATIGGFNPTGTITFKLSGPTDTFCFGPPVFTADVSVNEGSGTYPSPSFVPTVAGTYRWQVLYSGDLNNGATPISGCLTDGESVVVTAAMVTPTMSTTASQPVVVGGTVTDTATLAGGNTPTGSITFNLFGPDNAACTGAPAFTSVTSVNAGNGAYLSGAFTVAAVGVYRWTASYSGDAGNKPVSSGCGAANESVTVTKANTTIATQASGPVTVGATIGDTASLTGGFSPTGTITFDLFGPDNSTCTGPPATSSTKAVNGIGNYASALFPTTSPGTYRWVASYSGDANSNPAGPTACNDPAEAVIVTAAVTTTTSTTTTVPPTTTTSTTVPPTTTTSSTTIPGTTTTTTSTTIPGTTTTSTSTTIGSTTSTSTSTTVRPTTTTTGSTTTSTTIPEVPTTTSTTTTSTTTTTTLPPPTTTTTSTTAGAGPSAHVSPSTVEAGDTTVVSGGGFPGGSQLHLTLFSDPVLLATTTANALGGYQATVTIPAGTAPGTHTVVVSTTTGTTQAQTTLTVTAASGSATPAPTEPGALSFTGADVRGPSAAALILLVLGFVTLAASRRRPLR